MWIYAWSPVDSITLPKLVESICTLKHLRVLDLGIPICSNHAARLFSAPLEYVSIEWSDTLPMPISNTIKSLQIHGRRLSHIYPTSLSRFPQLEHLYILDAVDETFRSSLLRFFDSESSAWPKLKSIGSCLFLRYDMLHIKMLEKFMHTVMGRPIKIKFYKNEIFRGIFEEHIL